MSKNTALTWLECGSNKLSKLDVSKNRKLDDLRCDDNSFTKSEKAKLERWGKKSGHSLKI